MMNVLVIIPVCNPDYRFIKLLNMLQNQTVKNLPVLIIDSGTQHEYRGCINYNSNITIKQIPCNEFNHGGTRQLGMDIYPNNDIYVFLTQDAVLADEKSIECLLTCFKEPAVGCAFGRQLPHSNANFFSRIARLNNYGVESYIRSFCDREKYGIKTCFISNSYAAYRKQAMIDINGFPTNTILSEDMCVAAKMLKCGWKIAYNSDSQVYHSHNYSVWQEFKRYFDIGVFHARERWIREDYGQAEGEGVRFIIKELKLIIKNNPFLLCEMFFRDGMKILGYRLGLHESKLPIILKRNISMNRKYWSY